MLKVLVWVMRKRVSICFAKLDKDVELRSVRSKQRRHASRTHISVSTLANGMARRTPVKMAAMSFASASCTILSSS